MDRRIEKYNVPGIGEVWLQSLTAKDGIDVEEARVVDGKIDLWNYAATLVCKMRLRQKGGLYYRETEDLQDMDYAIFQKLHETCEQHRDYISPEDLAGNLFRGEADSPPTKSSVVQGLAASPKCSTESVSVSGASGKPSPSSAGVTATIPVQQTTPTITSIP